MINASREAEMARAILLLSAQLPESPTLDDVLGVLKAAGYDQKQIDYFVENYVTEKAQ